MTGPTDSTKRGFYLLGTTVAVAVTVIFATVGDGVEVPEATGLRRLAVEAGHIAVWALLSVAFLIAAVRGRWDGPAGRVAVAAGITYALFLLAVLL